MLSTDTTLDKLVTATRLLRDGQLHDAEIVLKEGLELEQDDYTLVLRYALVQVMRQILSGDKRFADSCLERLSLAEQVVSRRVADAETKFTELSHARRSFYQRISFQHTFSHPWCEGTEEVFETLGEAGKATLREWREAEGIHALVYLLRAVILFSKQQLIKGAWTLRSSWLLCKHVDDEKELPGDDAMFAQLVKGIFLVMLSNMPPFLQTVFKVIGFESNREVGLKILARCMEAEAFEPRTFSTILISVHHLLLSQQEYKSDCVDHMKKATHTINQELNQAPNSILAKLIQTHIIRRQGKLKEAMEIVDDLATTVHRELELVKSSADEEIHANRLEFDRAMLHFVCFNFEESIPLLEKLVDRDSFNAQVLATAIVASCHAMKPHPDFAKSQEMLEKMGVGVELGRMDRSIMLKKDTLLARKHKQLLAYEIFYIFGHMKCYSPAVASRNKDENIKWLNERKAELENIILRETGFDDLRAIESAKTGSDCVNVEEALACFLVIANIHALLDNLSDAEKILQTIIQLWTRKVSSDELDYKALLQEGGDHYVVPWSMYELSAIHLRRKEYTEAKPLLERAQKMAKNNKKQFSFNHMLAFKCNGALRECANK